MGGCVGAVPRGSSDASVSIAAGCDHCITSHLVQYLSLTSNCGSTCLQMRTRMHLATTRDHSQPIKRRHHAWRGTCYVALHPLRDATPVTWRCTRTERVQCLRIGCNAHGSGVLRSQTGTTVEPGIPQYERKRPQHPYTQTRTGPQAAASRVVLHPLWGAAPVAWRCTRTERVQCPRIGCNAHRSGAMPTDRVYRAPR